MKLFSTSSVNWARVLSVVHSWPSTGTLTYGGFGYNMLGMGMPGMNMLGGFPYGAMGRYYNSFIIDMDTVRVCIMYSNPVCLR